MNAAPPGPPRDPRNLPRFMEPPERGLGERLARWARVGQRVARGGLHLWLELSRCPVCGSRNLDLVQVGDRPCLFSCERCRLIFRDPRPSNAELRAFYESSRRVPGIGMPEEEAEMYRHHRGHCYNLVGLQHFEERFGVDRRALDVGCGNGLNLDVLLARGWQAEGVDPNPAQVAALERRGHRAAAVDLAQAADDPDRAGRYQLVTMLHVIEHLSDPLALVRALGAVLAPEGLLVVETPLCCDLANLDHLFFFSGTSLHILLEQAGFVWHTHFLYVAHGYAHDNLIVLAQKE